jgi:hypothetical protein
MACYVLQYLYFVGNAGGKEPLVVQNVIVQNYHQLCINLAFRGALLVGILRISFRRLGYAVAYSSSSLRRHSPQHPQLTATIVHSHSLLPLLAAQARHPCSPKALAKTLILLLLFLFLAARVFSVHAG